MKKRSSLGWRLAISHGTVVVVGGVTLLIVVLFAGPTAFESAMGHAMIGMGAMGDGMDPVLRAAFADALRIALIVAIATSALAAIVASLVMSRRIARPIERMAAASRRIAAGSYSERVEIDSDDDIGDLARSFDLMASSLETTEQRRQQLVGDVAHELRTPLATLDGYLEGLEDGIVEPGPETWSTLRAETGRLTLLVDDLQELWRVEAGHLPVHLSPIDLGTLAADAMQRFERRAAARDLRLEIAPGATGQLAFADERRTSQVLDNLLGNAMRYSDAGTTVLISVVASGGRTVLSVRDQGPGLTDEERDRVFERFYRTDAARSRARGGAGLGLAIAKALVEFMDGSIWVESDGPGEGTTFFVSLPSGAAAA
ncbi:MAG: sensor histidine kinase [Chloroflexota bacterium]